MSTNPSADPTSASSQAEAPTSTQASSDSGPTSTNNAPTSTPTAEPTTTTAPQSSPAQTSAATAATTSSPQTSSPGSSTSPTLTTAPTTTSPTTFTTQVATTLYTTDPAGSTVYITTTAPQVVTSSVDANTDSGSSSSHTGVIVGAVVGGVAGIALLALLLFCIRRRARKDEFDGNFDPDRIVGPTDGRGGTLPHVDLAEEVTPFPQPYTDQGSSSMRQYDESPYIAIPTSPATSGQASTEYYPPSAAASVNGQPRSFMQPGAGPPHSGAYLPPINVYGAGPVDWHTPRPGASPPPSTVSHNTSSTRAAKEREALERNGQGVRLGLATQPEAAEGSEDVVVHRDAGRAPAEEQTPPREIPPAYDSIRQD